MARRTFGWTGADLSGMMRNAASYAIDRSLNTAKGPLSSTTLTSSNNGDFTGRGGGGGGGGSLLTIGDVKITWEDVRQAYVESSRRWVTHQHALSYHVISYQTNTPYPSCHILSTHPFISCHINTPSDSCHINTPSFRSYHTTPHFRIYHIIPCQHTLHVAYFEILTQPILIFFSQH